jgi:hypothetical protein
MQLRTILDLPPWEAVQYFNQPVETVVASGGPHSVLVKGDPYRFLLIAYLQAGSTGSTVVSLTMNDNGTSGIQLNNTNLPLVLEFATHGPLVCQPWFVSTSQPGSGNVTVITHSMFRYPDDGGLQSLIEQVDNATDNAGAGQPYCNSFLDWINSACRSKSAQEEANYLAAAVQSCAGGAQWSRNSNGWVPPSRWRAPVYPGR